MNPKQVVFGTPLFQYHLKDSKLNAALTHHFETEKNQDTGIIRSNVGGWHSKIYFDDPKVECLKKFRSETWECFQHVLQQTIRQNWVTQWSQQSWAIISGKGDYNIPHCHPCSEWSSVYYVDVGESFEVVNEDRSKSFSGRIQFLDPRGSLLEGCKRLSKVGKFYDELYGPVNITMIPYTGLLVFFPAWLMHQVLTYQGDKPRIVISTNYILEQAEILV